MSALSAYQPTLVTMALAGLLLVVQLVIAHLAAIQAGHRGGFPVPADSSKFLFRSARAHANMNESAAAFSLLAITGMLASANIAWLNGLSVLWLLSRLAHMGFYYGNRPGMRSLSFAVSLLTLLGLAVTVLTA